MTVIVFHPLCKTTGKRNAIQLLHYYSVPQPMFYKNHLRETLPKEESVRYQCLLS